MVKRVIDYLFWLRRETFGSESIDAIYDDLSIEKYDRIVGYTDRVEGFKKALSSIQVQPKSILDIACGTGAMIDAMSWKNKAKIIGIDISQGMLDVARERFKKDRNISLKYQNFMDASFPKDSFDLITIAHATRFIPKGQEKDFARNIAKWLKKDGIFIVILHHSNFIHTIGVFLSRFFKVSRNNTAMDFDKSFSSAVAPELVLKEKRLVKRTSVLFPFYVRALYFQKKSATIALW